LHEVSLEPVELQSVALSMLVAECGAQRPAKREDRGQQQEHEPQ